ncbi:hypothetical protein BDU57DRAFT_367276 [Ampelomyces quisqualis]|uniref:Uncharacterized protein n=1 Tax=Ampelomyces quisqualis TaxID=50730 RepID=A0A6A5QAS8_AMPQU|nr:hypothetical protein BDU57DRAFT_367276 [Ampelomyces quisqualis]
MVLMMLMFERDAARALKLRKYELLRICNNSLSRHALHNSYHNDLYFPLSKCFACCHSFDHSISSYSFHYPALAAQAPCKLDENMALNAQLQQMRVASRPSKSDKDGSQNFFSTTICSSPVSRSQPDARSAPRTQLTSVNSAIYSSACIGPVRALFTK